MISQHCHCRGKGTTYSCRHVPREHGQYTYGFDCDGNELNKGDVLVCYCCGTKGFVGDERRLMSVWDWRHWEEGFDFQGSSWRKVPKEDWDRIAAERKVAQTERIAEEKRNGTYAGLHVG